MVAFGSAARICQKTISLARAIGLKIGLLRPITLWPFPSEKISELSYNVKGMLVVELNSGQMIDDVKLATNSRVPIHHYGRLGGVVFTPDEVLNALKNIFNL